MKKIILYTFAVVSAAVICGCSDNGETPPLSRERTQLVQGLFDSLEKGDKNAVMTRAEKLQQLAPDNAYLLLVLETMTANTYIVYAQKALDEGHEKLALDILAKGLQKHPLNRSLQNQYNQLKLLCDIEQGLKSGELAVIPRNLAQIPVHGPELIKKMQSKNMKLEKKD